MIIIAQKLLEGICRHACQSYPYECCGILCGKKNSHKEVLRYHPVTNLNRERAHDRYELDPGQFLQIDEQTRAAGLSILGFYHSHPDHPPAPSAFDTQRAWEEYSYLIVAVEGGKNTQVKSWILNQQGHFEAEEIASKPEGVPHG